MDDSTASLTTTQGAQAIKSILYPTQDQPTPQASINAPAPEAEVTPEQASDSDIETQEVEVDENLDDSGELYEVIVDGETKQVPLEELIKGYQLEAHYTKKSQKLAEERKAFEAERLTTHGINQKFEQLNEVVTYLTQVNNYVESTIPPEPDDSLLDTSPREYFKQKQAREQALQGLMAIRGTVEQTKAQAKQVVAELQKQGAAVISQKMPELMTQEGSTRLYSYLTESYGYTGEQINANVDPNLFIIAEKARRFDEMQGKVVSPSVAVKKPVKQVQKPRPLTNNSQVQTARDSFKSNGDLRSAAALIKASGIIK